MVINAQNKEKYLEDLKNWLCELENAPLEEMGAFFRKRLPEYEARMTKFWGEDYKQFARAVPESAKRILDLGCGTGLELDALYNLRTDISVIGIDLSPDMLDALMKKHGDKDLTLLCGSYFAVPFPGAFDAVISFESLHHFLPEKKRRLFKRIYDCLTPGGMFVNGDYFACCDEEEKPAAQNVEPQAPRRKHSRRRIRPLRHPAHKRARSCTVKRSRLYRHGGKR